MIFTRILRMLTLMVEIQLLMLINQCGESGKLDDFKPNLLQLKERFKKYGKA
jgi:hypothetical protein